HISVHVSNELLKAVPNLLEKLGVFPGGPQPEFQKGPGEGKELKQAPQGQGQCAGGPAPGSARRRAGVSPGAPWERAAATALPRLAVTSTRWAARLSV